MADGLVSFKVTLRSLGPMLLHNGRLADPLDHATRALADASKKRGKSAEDHEAVAAAEFAGSLYYSTKIGRVAIPAMMIEAAIRDGGKAHKLGKTMRYSVSVRSTIGSEDAPVFDIPLDYDGPTKPEDLYADQRFRDRRQVSVGQSKVMRTRPRFDEWSLTFIVDIDAESVDPAVVHRALEMAGRRVGIGDFRPTFGRFIVDSFEQVEGKHGGKRKSKAA